MTNQYVFGILLTSLIGISSAATAGEFPSSLNCQALECIGGESCDLTEDYWMIELRDANTQHATWGEAEGRFVPGKDEDSFVLDFSDGDQYLFFTLKQTGKESFEGTLEDGFDWINGYNIRQKFLVSCSIPKTLETPAEILSAKIKKESCVLEARPERIFSTSGSGGSDSRRVVTIVKEDANLDDCIARILKANPGIKQVSLIPELRFVVFEES